MKLTSVFLLIAIVCGVLTSWRYLKDRRFLEVIIILAVCFLPLYAILKAKHPLTSLLKHLLQQNVADAEVIDGLAIIILSPLLFFWIFWLFLSGYSVFINNFDLIHYLENHFRKKYIKSKVVGFSLIILGLPLFLLSLIFLGTGIWLFPLVTVSLLLYFIGAICLVLPKVSESKINEILCKIKNRNKRQ
jgi:hypothetical protein